MPELRELFETTTGHVEPHADPWLEQQQRQRRAKRNERVATFAVVVGIGLLLAAVWALGTRATHTSRMPANQPRVDTPTPPSTVPMFPNGEDLVGLVGLAPEGAKPSLPTRGELVLGFGFNHTWGDHGRFTVNVYADGRLIWRRLADTTRADEYSKPYTTGLLEQRLTPEGVELVRAEVISTGMFDRDLHLASGEGLTYGGVTVRNGDRVVQVDWGDDIFGDVTGVLPTPEQANLLRWLDARLENPASWLPASAWEDQRITAFVPSGYSVCYHGGERQGLGLSQVLDSLPPAAADLLLTQEKTLGQAPAFDYWCSDLRDEEARTLARILDDAGLESDEDVFGLTYDHVGWRKVWLEFAPLLPHEAI